jgi:hypothetical protein
VSPTERIATLRVDKTGVELSMIRRLLKQISNERHAGAQFTSFTHSPLALLSSTRGSTRLVRAVSLGLGMGLDFI